MTSNVYPGNVQANLVTPLGPTGCSAGSWRTEEGRALPPGYDTASRLQTLTFGDQVFRLDYDDASRRRLLTCPNTATTTYTYNAVSQLADIHSVLGPTTINRNTYTYDSRGNRKTNTASQFGEEYAYDALSRLTVAKRSDGSHLWTYGYDRVGNRTSHQSDATVSQSTYAANRLLSTAGGGPTLWRGQLDEPGTVSFTSATINGVPARMLAGNMFEAPLDLPPGSNTVTITAKDANQNTTVRQYQVNVAGGAASYTYDLNGNLETKTEGTTVWRYEWTVENELARVLRDSVEVARFEYDPLGRRISETAGGATEQFTYDGPSILRSTSIAATTTYFHGPGIDEPLGRRTQNGNLRYFFADGLGSIVKTTLASGAIVQDLSYEPYGALLGGNAAFAFTGREWDVQTGLYYYRARYYDPKIGRFLSEDPIGFAGGDINRYAYVRNNPAILVDPSGLTASDNMTIFVDWVFDLGQSTRYYFGNDQRTQDIMNTAAIDKIRGTFAAAGCPQGFTTFSQPSIQAYGDTVMDPTNSTQLQVGGFTGVISNPGTGVITFHAYNRLSTRSFFGESASQQVLKHPWILPVNPRGGAFPFMGLMDQHFVWQETCACK